MPRVLVVADEVGVLVVADGVGDTIRLIARHSGLVLDVNNEWTADGTLLGQWIWKSAANQQFKLKIADPNVSDVAGKGHPGGAGGNGGKNRKSAGKSGKADKGRKSDKTSSPASANP